MGRRLEKYYLFCNTAFLSLFTKKFVQYIYVTTKYTLKLEQAYKIYRKFLIYIGNIGNVRYISEILDLFCKRFLFQLRVYFVVYIYLYIGNFRYISEIYNIVSTLFLFQLKVYFVVYNKWEISSIFWTNFIVN